MKGWARTQGLAARSAGTGRTAWWRVVGLGACAVLTVLATSPAHAASPTHAASPGHVTSSDLARLDLTTSPGLAASSVPAPSLALTASPNLAASPDLPPVTSPILATPPGTAACEGVSVVVDFGALGAPGVRGCAPLEPQDSVSGLDALTGAGLSLEGTAQWGSAFICRVDGRPGSQEDITLPDGQTVRESCARTPSQQAYWSLWHADGAEWRYATTGAGELDLGVGDAVALVFTTGSQAATPPPVLPAQARSGDLPSGWSDRAPAGTPSADSAAEEPTDGPADDRTGDGTGDGTGEGTHDPTDDPTDRVTDADGTDVVPDSGSTGVGIVPLAAIALVLLGGVGATVVARRRR